MVNTDGDIPLVRLAKRQKRPATGDVFYVQMDGGEYYFGLVIDGNMAIGPLAPGSILVAMFAERSETTESIDVDAVVRGSLLMAPAIVNQRLWTLGYARKVGETRHRPEATYVFKNSALQKYFDKDGHETRPKSVDWIGIWGLGNELTLADDIMEAASGLGA